MPSSFLVVFEQSTCFSINKSPVFYDGHRFRSTLTSLTGTILCRDYDDVDVYRLGKKKLALLKRKLELSTALKSLHSLILQSKEASSTSSEDDRRKDTGRGGYLGNPGSTSRYATTPRYTRDYVTEDSSSYQTLLSQSRRYQAVEAVTRAFLATKSSYKTKGQRLREYDNYDIEDSFSVPGTTVVPWWARTNSHGRRRRRRKVPRISIFM